MKIIIFILPMLISCVLSNEQHLLDECKQQRNRSYLYLIPILERYAGSIDRSQSQTVYITNVEFVDQKCKSEARKSRFELRTN